MLPTESPIEVSNPFDSGPLSTIRAEIGHSLTEVHTALDKVRIVPTDSVSLQRALSQLHQITGALSMVGLPSAAHLNEELEKLIGAIGISAATATLSELSEKATAAIDATYLAIKVLGKYLDELIGGEPNRPLKLAKTYVSLNTLRGALDASDRDLFFPDLTLTTPPPDASDLPPPTTIFVDAIREARAVFQGGLLKLLREKDLINGVREMRRAVATIEALKASSPSRSFWFSVIGFFDAVAIEPTGAGALATQLFGKIDQQIKLLVEGPRDAPEKLFRELLYVIGKSSARNDHLCMVRTIYDLDNLLWTPGSALNYSAAGPKLVDTLLAQVHAQKEMFTALSHNNPAALEPFTRQTESIAIAGTQLANKELGHVLQILGAVGKHLEKSGVMPNPVQAIEIATALLFVESSLENYTQLSNKFSQQATAICARLRSAMTGVDLQVLNKPVDQFADTMTLRAQTHLLIFQVGREVQINLATIEGLFDNHFRDPAKPLDLTVIEPLLNQVHGALVMLDLNEAAKLCKLISEQVVKLANVPTGVPTVAPTAGNNASSGKGVTNPTASADVAAAVEGLTALGLYVGALQQGAVEPRNVLLPTLVRFGLAAERRAVERPRPKRAVEKIAMPAPVARAVSANLQDVAAAAAPKAPPVNLDSALTEIKRLNAMESELRKMVLDRNKRINALELVVANLIAKMKK